MSKFKILVWALGLASLGAAGPCLAWGPEGHTIVARVAANALQGQAASDLNWIITTGVPALNAQMQQAYGNKCQIDPADPWGPVPNPTTDKDQHTNLANWADCYRYQDASTSGWHFNDIPLGQTPTGALDAASQPWCPTAKSCISLALADNLRKLATPNQAPADAARALAYVVHFMGDLHQPLHEEDNGDIGGNEVLITTKGAGVSATKLHALWDTPLVQAALGKSLDKATSTLAADVANADAPSNVDTVDEVIASSDRWAEDTHALASPAYSQLHIAVGAGKQQGVPVSKAYVKLESQVVRTQLVLSAIRLKAALGAALTWSPPS